MLQPGLYSVPSGMIATIVTSLEMFQIPALRPEIAEPNWSFEKFNPNLEEYRHLYKTVGEDWLWVSRLLINDDALRDIIGSPDVEIYKLASDTRGVGMIELDFRQEDECELTFFGVSWTLIRGPAGRWLMIEPSNVPGLARSIDFGSIPVLSTIRQHLISISAPASSRSVSRWRSSKIPGCQAELRRMPPPISRYYYRHADDLSIIWTSAA